MKNRFNFTKRNQSRASNSCIISRLWNNDFSPFFSFHQVFDSNTRECFSGFVIVHFSFVPFVPCKSKQQFEGFLEIGTQNFRQHSCHFLLRQIKKKGKKVCSDLWLFYLEGFLRSFLFHTQVMHFTTFFFSFHQTNIWTRMFAAKNVGFSSIFAEIYGNAIETTNCNVLFFKWLSKQSFYKLKYVIA